MLIVSIPCSYIVKTYCPHLLSCSRIYYHATGFGRLHRSHTDHHIKLSLLHCDCIVTLTQHTQITEAVIDILIM